jgi:hypothetical protein
VPKPKKMGRPKLPKGEAMGKIVALRFNAEDRKRLEAAAKTDGISVSEWVRAAVTTSTKGREWYKDFYIDARSRPMGGRLGWNSMFSIENHETGGAPVITPFYLTTYFPTQEKAIEAALAHGRKKIDDGFSA